MVSVTPYTGGYPSGAGYNKETYTGKPQYFKEDVHLGPVITLPAQVQAHKAFIAAAVALRPTLGEKA